MKKLTIDERKLFKNFIGFFLFFTIIIFSLEKSIAYFVSLSGDSQTGKVNLIMKHKIDPTIVVFGSSVAEVGFNSNVLETNLNTSVYNMAIDGTPIIKSEFLIDEFLSYSKNCDTVIIGIAFFSLSKMEKMTKLNRYLAYKSNVHLKKNIEEVAPELYAKLYRVPFYSFISADHTYYKNAYIGFKNKLKGIDFSGDLQKGFVPHDVKYFDTTNSEKLKKKIEFSEKTIKEFEVIINKITAHNITPILVITPMHINGQNSFSNYKEYVQIAEKIANKTNTRLIDFSKDEIVKKDKYFYNNGHLNKSGALKFSKKVCDSLKN